MGGNKEMTDRQKYKNLYWCWKALKQRTLNPNCKAYHNYGGRGIGVCNDWKEFEPFLEWALSNGWRPGLELDRINNDGDYEPDNCRWVSRKINLNNTRQTLYATVNGEKHSISEWADITKIPHGSLKIWHETKGEDYVSERIGQALIHGYKQRDYGNTHRKRIVCIDTGERFDSLREAARCKGLSPCTISNAMKRGGKTSKGRFTWEEVK